MAPNPLLWRTAVQTSSTALCEGQAQTVMTCSKCHLNKWGKKTHRRQFSMKPARCGPGLRAMRHAFAVKSGEPFTQITIGSHDSAYIHICLSFGLWCLFNNAIHKQMGTSADASNLYPGGVRLPYKSFAFIGYIIIWHTAVSISRASLNNLRQQQPCLWCLLLLLSISRQMSKEYADCGVCCFYSISPDKCQNTLN
jgi:hypothetical protein